MNIKVVKKGSTRPVQAPVVVPKKAVVYTGPMQARVTCKADALRLLGGRNER